VHVWFAATKARAGDIHSLPKVIAVDGIGGYRILTIERLAEMLLALHRNQDRMHVRDLINVGLINRSWLAKLPPLLAERLQAILDTPDG
jgi:hypothetical protein